MDVKCDCECMYNEFGYCESMYLEIDMFGQCSMRELEEDDD